MIKGPILFDLESEQDAPNAADAPPVPDILPPAHPQSALQTAAYLAAGKPSRLTRAFWGVTLALLGALISIAAWDFASALLARTPVVGGAISGLFAAFITLLSVIALREAAAVARLSRLDHLRHTAKKAQSSQDLAAARALCGQLDALYRARPETRWGRDRLTELGPDQLDAPALLSLAEVELLAPLDRAAITEIEHAVRRVATVTALVPLALVDMIAVLAANLRMIRRIAEIYGGRSGFWSSWRLTRAVLTHLVATGAVAIGDDLLEPLLGGTVLAKLSRRFGEGIVNGALTARVGVAAMEVCRPLPFSPEKRPKVRQVIKRALASLFAQGKES